MSNAGKIAIVTGGASGIGRATVIRLANEGASVVIADIDRARMDALASELAAAGRKVLPVYCDLTDTVSVRQMIEKTVATFGRLDVLVNCAGGSGMTPFYKSEEGKQQKWAEEIPESEWEATLALNLTAPFLCCKHALPYMKRQGKGTIVNFSSVGADIGRADGGFAYAAYAAAKAGVTGLTRHLAVELGPFGITVNCVCPGAVLSERIAARYEGQWGPDQRSKALKGTPLGRMGQPEELAAAVAFLASDDASFITGITLDVNGGRYMR